MQLSEEQKELVRPFAIYNVNSIVYGGGGSSKVHPWYVVSALEGICCKQYCGAYGTLGGVLINHKMEVMTDDYEVIPGRTKQSCCWR